MTIEYAIPKSTPVQTRNYDLALPAGLSPQKVGMLANGFPDAEKYLGKQVAALAHYWPGATFRIDKKASADQLNIGIQEPLLSELSRDCDVMIIAWGHCGSCTSGIARDAIAFAERGIPSVMLVCEVFWEYSAWIGEALGMSNLAKVRLPFPIAGTGEQAQLLCAERIAPEIVERLSKH